ncbi:TonB-dependent receptor [Tunturiibacter gelidiferens]|uniref:TonB-dependent receptor n=1 Tax=Tunturiibacter gelidiferens TaxID=3069689 RepID=UPI003D9AB6DC
MPIRRILATLVSLFLLDLTWPMLAQVNTGELRLKVTDPTGLGISADITISSSVTQYRTSLPTSNTGEVDIKILPYGIYLVRAESQGFTATTETVEVRSALPSEHTVKLNIETVNTSVQVSDVAPLVDPHRPSSVMQIGAKQIQDREASLPGRSVQDLVDTQPGWLYEGNAVLHPRGSEYQTQFVIDGIPLTDNRSPSFGPEIGADDLDSISILTAGFPAEYGRKLGGIVELNTRRQTADGLHGQVVLSGGSYDTGAAYAQLQDVHGRNTFGATASGSMSAHYLNPVVPENYTNRGTTGDFSAHYERDLTQNDRLRMSVRHELSRFEIPNELVQQQAGQLQTGDNFETMGTVHYQHIFSPNSLGTLAGMVRDNANNLNSNLYSTPILPFQHNYFREGFFKATYSLRHGHHELKAGVESDNAFLHENFSYLITDSTQFDDNTPPSLAFTGHRSDLEQSAFVEDLIRLGEWTISAGLRWDHYQLLLNQNAFSPRISIGRYLPSLNMVLHASYDRIFQTPSFENILISSSPQIDALNNNFLRLPVQPSRGNYYEGGLSQAFAQHMSIDINVFRRNVTNFADDDQLLNTGVSYPISFNKAIVYGAEGKLSLVHLGNLSGYASYSYMVANVWFPVTGGLFLGDDAAAAVAQTTGHFPASQDQRNTLRTRFRYQVLPHLWFAAGLSYGSGLPFQFAGDQADALAQYGPQVISRINFDRGRILPMLAIDATLGADLYKSDRMTMRFQADGSNLNDRLNVIDFGGLFSGNAIAPARSYTLRLTTNF